MPRMMNDAAFRAYAIACSILAFKMLAAAILTAATRTRVKQFLNPEDARTLGGTGVKEEHPDVLRMLRLHRNDLENILPFFIVGLFYLMTHPSMLAAEIYGIGYLVVRTLHSVFYIRSMQPHRTIAFTLGSVLTLAMLVQTLVVVLRAG